MSSDLPSPHDNCSSYDRPLCEEFAVEADSDQSEAECAASNNDLQCTVVLDMDAALLCRLLFDFARHEGAADSPLKTSHPEQHGVCLSAIFGGERWDYSRPRIRGNVAEGAAGSVGEGKERQGSRQTRNRYWQGIEHR